MRRLVCCAAAWMLGAMVGGPLVSGQEPAGKETPKAAPAEKKEPALRGEYAIMASELKLTDEQKAKLADKVKARNEAVEAWEKEKGAKIKELQDALKALEDERRKLRETQAAEIMSVLTDEQKAKWEDFQFYVRVVGQFARAKLTDEQKAKVRALTDAARPEFKKAAEDRKALSALEKKLAEDITTQVLTPEQKAELEKKPAPRADQPKPGQAQKDEPKKDEPKKDEPVK